MDPWERENGRAIRIGARFLVGLLPFLYVTKDCKNCPKYGRKKLVEFP